MKLDIRRATREDAAELDRLNTRFNGAGSLSPAAIARSLAENEQEQVYVAVQGERLVGFCCVQLFKSFCYSRHYVEITELFVEEAYRRRQVATRLMQHVEAEYRGRNIGGFQLFTGGTNQNAQRFYEKMGYTKTDELMYRKRL
ncbi:MAG: GNAT family N-acetyltransferase [Clostridiaceae bacterium]|jgi:ribosomal protein S18 acetylase RimI-like enzyme|nr:GNAT family N-acetyltransferase [Clostridiaceae bacterium]